MQKWRVWERRFHAFPSTLTPDDDDGEQDIQLITRRSVVTGTNVHEQSRSDFCRLRFKTRGLSRMYALSRDVTAPGVLVYDSGLSFAQCRRATPAAAGGGRKSRKEAENHFVSVCPLPLHAASGL